MTQRGCAALQVPLLRADAIRPYGTFARLMRVTIPPLLHKEGKGFAQPKAFSSEEKVARFAEPDEVDTPQSGTLFADQ